MANSNKTKLKILKDKADALGISNNLKLAQYILDLEERLELMRDKIRSIQGSLYTGR